MGPARLLERHPGAAELRVIRALAHDAIAGAWRHGEERMSFRGYRIAARRLNITCADDAYIELTVSDRGGELLERLRIAVACRPNRGSAFAIEYLPAVATASRRSESPVGCVSPFDARYASPEAGLIS